MFQGYDEFAELNKANVDAVIISTNTVAKGFESISKELMGFMQASVESNVVVAKKVIGAKNLQEVVDLQSDFARTSFDSLLAESAKLTELSVQVTNKAIEPLQSRVHVTVEKMMKPVAA
jgi:phasin family protein